MLHTPIMLSMFRALQSFL